jgi:hypothetical protein
MWGNNVCSFVKHTVLLHNTNNESPSDGVSHSSRLESLFLTAVSHVKVITIAITIIITVIPTMFPKFTQNSQNV